MKTPKEWMDWLARETNDPNQKGYTHEVLLTQEAIAAIQQDAFESGRVSGRVQEMNRVARLVENELPMTAESFRKWARELESPPVTKSDVEVQK